MVAAVQVQNSLRLYAAARRAHQQALHGGMDRTLDVLKEQGFHINKELKIIVKSILSTCTFCQLNRRLPEKRAIQRVLPVPLRLPYREVVIDECKGLEKSTLGFDSFLTVVCRRTGLIATRPMRDDMSAEEMSASLWSIWAHWGTPATIWADEGSRFTSSFFKTLCQQRGIYIHFGTPDFHKTQGQVEVAHQRILEVLRAMIFEQQRVDYFQRGDWPMFLDEAVLALNNQRQDRLEGLSPNEATVGFKLRHIGDAGDQEWRRWKKMIDLIVQRDFYRKLRRARALNEANGISENIEDNGVAVGDLVKIRQRDRRKLDLRFEGPFIVLQVDRDRHSAKIEPLAGGLPIHRHTSVLLPWMETEDESPRGEDNDDGKTWADLVSEDDEAEDPETHEFDNYLLIKGEELYVQRDKVTWWISYQPNKDDLVHYLEKGKWHIGVIGKLSRAQRNHLKTVKKHLHPWTRMLPTAATVGRMKITRKSKDAVVVGAMKDLLG